MISITLLFVFIFGTIIGSFVNVVSLRYNTSLPIATGRSKCQSCNVQLRWFDMIPIVSFFLLKGKCRDCKSTVSLQYPVIEFTMGIIFTLVALRQFYYFPLYSSLGNGMLHSVFFFFFYAFVFCLLFIILIYDIRHKIIPNALVYTFIAVSFLKLGLFFYYIDFVITRINIFDLLAPVILFLPFFLIWYFSKGKWLGFGDVKLVIGIGAFLGFVLGVSAVILAFWLGAAWSIGYMVYVKFFAKPSRTAQVLNWQSEIPFAPFLVISVIIVFFTHIDVLNLGAFLGFL